MPVIRMSHWPRTGIAYCSKAFLDDLLVHRLGLAGVTGDHLVLRRTRVKQLASRRPRQLAHRVAHRLKLHAVEGGEVVLVLQQEVHVASVHAIVDGRFDVKDVQLFVDNLAQPVDLVIQLRARRIHVAV